MHLNRWHRIAGLLLGMALLWAVAGSLHAPLDPFSLIVGVSRAAPTPSDTTDKPAAPADSGAAAATDPAAPADPNASAPAAPADSGAAAAAPMAPADQAAMPAAPMAPANQAATPAAPMAPADTSAGATMAPADTGTGATMAPASMQPAQPAPAAQEAPPASATMPMSPGLQSSGGKIEWGRDFHTWDVATGYVISASHGNRLVQTYIYPPEATRVFRHNSELALLHKMEGYEAYPVGTQIVQESWLRNDLGGPGAPGPVFLMRKESPGYDPAGGDWRYGFTRDDLSLIGDGHEGKMQTCKECHARAKPRDYVYGTER
jgi:Cytochrome P460